MEEPALASIRVGNNGSQTILQIPLPQLPGRRRVGRFGSQNLFSRGAGISTQLAQWRIEKESIRWARVIFSPVAVVGLRPRSQAGLTWDSRARRTRTRAANVEPCLIAPSRTLRGRSTGRTFLKKCRAQRIQVNPATRANSGVILDRAQNVEKHLIEQKNVFFAGIDLGHT